MMDEIAASYMNDSNPCTNRKSLLFTLSSKSKILKNLVLLAFGQFLIFTAFDSISNLQSTINSEDGVGLASQAVIYAFFTASSFFLPTYIIRRIGCKCTLVVSVFSICPYILANIYPYWETLMPSAILCGTAFGPFWAARSTYINEISHQYSSYSYESVGVVNAWFFGISSFFHENAEIWGNVISYFVLKPSNMDDVAHNVTNVTLLTCGASFCNDEYLLPNPNLVPPSEDKRHMLMHVYLVLVIIAGIVIKFFIDPLKESSKAEPEASGMTCNLLIATFRQMKKKDQLLLLPLTFYCGIADGFYNSDFTKSYIACSWGISQVGYVTIAYGITCAIMDCSSGVLVKYVTRVPVFLLGATAHAAVLITCLMWKPSPEYPAIFFLLSGMYGIGSSVWWSQIAAFYGVIFKTEEEAAFSNFYFWSSLGLLIAYAYSNSLCTWVKIYVVLIILFIGIISYLIVETKHPSDKDLSKKCIQQTELSTL